MFYRIESEIKAQSSTRHESNDSANTDSQCLLCDKEVASRQKCSHPVDFVLISNCPTGHMAKWMQVLVKRYSE